MSTGFEQTNNQLFSGSNQYERFAKALHRCFHKLSVAEKCKELGIKPENLGAHSERKGGLVYATSGTTAAPNIISVQLRAGWHIEGVANRYLRYSEAGDQHVGRTVAGLPPLSSSFAILPPFFPSRTEAVNLALRISFPRAPENLSMVLEYCLASVVYHRGFLRSVLPCTHPLWFTPLFTASGLLDNLAQLVECKVADSGCRIRATGIPPIVAIFQDMAALRKGTNEIQDRVARLLNKMDDIVPALETKCDKVIAETAKAVLHGLEERSIVANHATLSGVRELLEPLRADITALRDGRGGCCAHLHSQPPAGLTASSGPQPEAGPRPAAFFWHNKFRKVPENFAIPRGTVEKAFRYYSRGDPAKDFPPLRELALTDVGDDNMGHVYRNKRRRLAEVKTLFRPVEAFLRESGQWVDNPTEEEVQTMFTAGRDVLSISATTRTNRKRRLDQLQWTTAARHIVRESTNRTWLPVSICRGGEAER